MVADRHVGKGCRLPGSRQEIEYKQSTSVGCFTLYILFIKRGDDMPRAKLNPNQVNEDTLQDADNDTKVQVEASSDEDKIRLSTGGSERMIIDNAGLVGIGTPSPTEILTINAASDDDECFIQFQEGGDDRAKIGINTSNNFLIHNQFINKHIVFKVNDQGTTREALRIDGAVSEVVVNQSGESLVDFRVESDNNTHMLFVDGANDKVGINTSSPSHAFTVNGQLSASVLFGDGSNLTGIGGGGGGTPAGADSQIQYNNGGSFGAASVLVYDDTNARVGIGLTTPQTTLHVHADSINNGAVTISQADNSGDASQLDLSKARGSGVSPATIQDGDFVGQVRMLAYDGDSYDNFADIYAQAAGTVTTTSHPTRVVIRTTQANSTSPTAAVTIDENQNMTVDGNIYGRMLHMTHHRYNDGSGTGLEYIPWAGTSEQPSPSWISQGIAPYEGKLLKVMLRSTKGGGLGPTTVGIHTNVNGNNVVSSTPTETATVDMTTVNTTYTFTFSSNTHFGPGDIIGVSVDPTNSHGNVNVTCVWEYDITA